jgi:2-methylcitrate dehydratase PrpD
MLVAFGGPGPSPGELVADLGQRWDICETSIKRYPCGGQTHAAVAAMLELRDSYGLSWQEVEHIDVQLARDAIPIIDNNPLLIANVQYVLALALHEGQILRTHFTDSAWTQNPDVWATKAKVTVRESAEISANFPAKKGAVVTVTTARGTFSHAFDAPPGSPWHPLSATELKGKFMELTSDVLTGEASLRLWELLEHFETVTDTSEFFDIIAAQGSRRRPEVPTVMANRGGTS